MNTEQIVKEVKSITLAHMEMDIDTEKLFLDDYPGAERHLAVYLVQGYYRRYLNGLGDNPKQVYLNKALTHSKWFTINRLTQELPGLIERTTVFMLDEAEREGWFADMEYENVSELLASMYDDSEASASEHSDYSFIVNTLIPTARSFNIDTDKVMGASVQTKKLRGMVPHVRELLHRQETSLISAEETAATLKWMFSQVADTDISYLQMKDAFNEWHGKTKEMDKPLLGYQMIVSGEETWMLVPVHSEKERAMVEQALRNRVDFRLTGMDTALKMITDLFKKDGNNEYVHNSEFVLATVPGA